MAKKTEKARLDADGTAAPKTRIVGHARHGDVAGPGITKPDAYEAEDGGRTPLGAPTYVLTRDGVEVLRGTELELVRWIHANHGYSASHACEHEGYAIGPEVPDPGA
jgi:hypothetical protein